MLDTNICIFAIKNRPAAVLARLRQKNPSDVCISSITYGELCCGVEKSRDASRNRLALTLFLAPIQILAWDDAAAQEYGRIRAALERRGTPIGPLDTLIAAHAKSQGRILATNNAREFLRVEGLAVEDWAAE